MSAEAMQAYYPETAEEAFSTASGLVFRLDKARHVAPPEVAWGECRWRIVGYDPGGQDPAGMVAVGVYPALSVKQAAHPAGVRGMWRHHVYGSWRSDGPISAFDVRDYVGALGGVDRVFVAETGGSTLVQTLQAMRLPAYQAPMAKREGIGHMRWLLESDMLSISPACDDLIGEFGTYWVKPRRDLEVGGGTFPTLTPAEHHADLIDALRAAAMGVLQSLPGQGATIQRVGDGALRMERAG